MMDTVFPVIPDKKHPLRRAVYDRFLQRNPLKSKVETYQEIANEFGISVPTVQRYIRRMESGSFTESGRQGRHVYAWSDEALNFFTNFYLAALAEVGGCTVRNAYSYTKQEALKNGWEIGSEQSAYVHARNISPAMIMLAKGGQRALDNMFYISRDLSKLKPMQLIVGDQHRFDFWCLDEDGTFIRAECYLWLDMATRVVYGISFDRHYNTRTVVRALRMGLQRFGKFESTYNDNGSSEKSDLSTRIVEALQNYGVRFLDESDLYHADNGRYIVEDTEGSVVDVVNTRAEWERAHRRIFARVKNAKTKPIERFFNTLEQILRDTCTPGYIKEMGLSAPEEEQAAKRLKWQQSHGYILTYDEFIKRVLEAISIYENRIHGTLKCSPKERLNEYIREGWQPTYIDKRDEAYLFMESAYATVKGDRVTLNNTEYIGPDLTKEMILANRGTLVAYNRRKIELRYDPENLDIGVFAIEPGTHNAILLTPVQKIDMLDEGEMLDRLQWKKRNMRAVQEAFEEATKNKNVRVLSDQKVFTEFRKAEELAGQALAIEDNASKVVAKTSVELQEKPEPVAIPRTVIRRTDEDFEYMPRAVKTDFDLSDEEFTTGLAERISTENVLRAHNKEVFMSENDRYGYVIKKYYEEGKLTREEMEFMYSYERRMTPTNKNYWEKFINQNYGGR